jgi:hypothetical protein
VSRVLVQRALDYRGPGGGSALIEVYQPAPTPGHDDWRCEFRLSWPSYEKFGHAIGIDAWQALELAMKVVPSYIYASADFKGGRIGIWGEPLATYEDICECFGVKPQEARKQ